MDRGKTHEVITGPNAAVHMTSAEFMADVPDKSVDLLVADGVYLGKRAGWDKYAELYMKVYVEEGVQRVLKPDGYMISFHTDQYKDNEVIPRWSRFMDLVTHNTLIRLIDVKIWKRRNADHYQPSFTHVGIFAMPEARRPDIRGQNDYFKGIWDYPALTGGKLNAFPDEICEMVIRVLSKPGKVVLEPMCGTARLLGIAAHMGRSAIGYEIDEELVDTIRENLNRDDFGLI